MQQIKHRERQVAYIVVGYFTIMAEELIRFCRETTPQEIRITHIPSISKLTTRTFCLQNEWKLKNTVHTKLNNSTCVLNHGSFVSNKSFAYDPWKRMLHWNKLWYYSPSCILKLQGTLSGRKIAWFYCYPWR